MSALPKAAIMRIIQDTAVAMNTDLSIDSNLQTVLSEFSIEVIRHMALKGTNVAEAAGARTVSKDHVLSALDKEEFKECLDQLPVKAKSKATKRKRRSKEDEEAIRQEQIEMFKVASEEAIKKGY